MTTRRSGSTQNTTHNCCLQDCREARSPVRKHSKHNTQFLPTRLPWGKIAGQETLKTQHTIPAYKTAVRQDRRSGNTQNTTHNSCLQDRREARSPVRKHSKHNTQFLPTRPPWGKIAGQEALHTNPTSRRQDTLKSGNTQNTIPALAVAS